MFKRHSHKTIPALLALILLTSACGTSQQTNDQIATSVALTVLAQNSLTKIADQPTATTLAPTFSATFTPSPLLTDTPLAVGAPGCTVSAQLVAENPPDGTLMKPGEYFWKTWSLKNIGTCTWDSTYKLVYSRGDLMGGLISYALPKTVAPGEILELSIYLQAPVVNGTYAGFWLIQTPWNAYFGIIDNSPFYVEIVVNDAAKPNYGIVSVTYTLTRDPAEGCPTNVRYTVNATISVNGPFEFDYYWDQSDGNESGIKPMKFTQAGSQTISRTWMVGKGDSPNPRWMQIIVTSPTVQEYERFVFLNNCP